MKPIEQHILERVDKYILQRMSDEERVAFEADLKSDESLAEAYAQQRDVQQALGYAHVKASTAELFAARKTTKPSRRVLWLSLAAGICLLVACYFLLRNGEVTSDQLYAQYYTQDPGLPTLMGATDGEAEYNFYEGMVAYKSGEYGQALALWNQIETKDRYRDTLPYYMAMAHLGLEEYNAALTELNRSGQLYPAKRLWYAALIAIKSGDTEKARSLLSEIPEDEPYYYNQAQALLHDLP